MLCWKVVGRFSSSSGRIIRTLLLPPRTLRCSAPRPVSEAEQRSRYTRQRREGEQPWKETGAASKVASPRGQIAVCVQTLEIIDKSLTDPSLTRGAAPAHRHFPAPFCTDLSTNIRPSGILALRSACTRAEPEGLIHGSAESWSPPPPTGRRGDGETGHKPRRRLLILLVNKPVRTKEQAGKMKTGTLKPDSVPEEFTALRTRVRSLKQIYDSKHFFPFSPKQNYKTEPIYI